MSSGSLTGILLVGHGTRDEIGVNQFLQTAGLAAAAMPEFALEACFLELAEPPIHVGIARLAARGVERIVVAPLLLFAAGHAKQDLPSAVQVALQPWPSIVLVQSAPLGCHPAILELSRQRYSEAISKLESVLPQQTAVLFVGRGSHDQEATEEMHRFAALSAAERWPGGNASPRVEVCFYAMAKPSLTETLERVAASKELRRVVIQPHLLFDGLLLAGIRQEVERMADRNKHIEWIVAEPLGPVERLVEATTDRIMEAIAQIAAAKQESRLCGNLRK